MTRRGALAFTATLLPPRKCRATPISRSCYSLGAIFAIAERLRRPDSPTPQSTTVVVLPSNPSLPLELAADSRVCARVTLLGEIAVASVMTPYEYVRRKRRDVRQLPSQYGSGRTQRLLFPVPVGSPSRYPWQSIVNPGTHTMASI